jgi:hypothetical protein
MASSFKSPILQAIDQNGNPVPGAKLFVFASGTTTPVVIYSNQSLTTPLPNPLIANARGYFASAGGIVQNIWWDGQALRLRLTGPDDSVIWEIDDYSAASGADPAANINVTGIWAGANARSLAALKARSVAGLTGGEVIQLNAGGRSGQFAWVTGNQSGPVTADPQQGIWIAPDSDPTGASGAWRRLNIPYVDGWVNVDWFGAVGDGSTDDQPAFAAAHDYLGLGGGSTGKFRGGTIQYGAKRYLLNSTFAITERGITLRGHMPERSGADTASSANGGVLIFSATSGPGIGVWNDDICLENVDIGATTERKAAAVSRSPRGSNCGVSIETPDAPNAFLVRPTLRNVLVRAQPGDGFLMQGDVIQAWLENCTAIDVGGHQYAVDRGDITGRTNKSRPGIMNFMNCRGRTSGGHTMCIGHPDNGAAVPYRVHIQNFEGFFGGRDASQRYDDSGWFIFGENITVQTSATSGRSDVTPDLATASIAGRQIKFTSCRYINGLKHILLRQRAGLGTRLIDFDGGFASSIASPAPEFFIEADAGCRQIKVNNVDGDFTSIINDATLAGLVVSRPVVGAGWDILHRSDLDFNNSGRIRSIRGNTTTPFALLNDAEFIQIEGQASSSTQIGMLRLTQASGGTGDATIRTQVGGNAWSIGQRRANNTFCVRNQNSFSNAGNIINIIGDGGTNGFVGIGPNTTVPAHRLDIDGSINVRTGGAFRFNGTQVLGAQVINANIADPAAITAQTLTDNSGGTASTTIAAIGATYDQDEVRNAVASLADQINKLKADVDELRAKSVAANTTIRTHGLGAAS